ncbi:MAG TPA: DedA family protein [Streptosporangiaceae bacterium]|nr:DedA family protein [Streptosporangiaceae bacterium]
MSSIISGLSHLSGWVAYAVIAALVFGETALFLGFVLPGETAVVIGGVLASRGHLSLATLAAVVVVTAVAGPIVGYEIGRRMGDRLFAEPGARAERAGPGGRARRAGRSGLAQARSVLRQRGGLAVFLGRFVAFARAMMPAAAGAARVPYRTFLLYNVVGGLVWGVGYCLLGYAAGSAYSAVERRVGTGLAIAVAAVVVVGLAVWAVRRHRGGLSRREDPGPEEPGRQQPGGEVPGGEVPGGEVPGGEVPGAEVPDRALPGAEVAGAEAAGDAANAVVPGVEGAEAATGAEVPGMEVPGVAAADAEVPGMEVPGVAVADNGRPGAEVRGGQGSSGEGTGGPAPAR